jgi:hypothetical protein
LCSRPKQRASGFHALILVAALLNEKCYESPEQLPLWSPLAENELQAATVTNNQIAGIQIADIVVSSESSRSCLQYTNQQNSEYGTGKKAGRVRL